MDLKRKETPVIDDLSPEPSSSRARPYEVININNLIPLYNYDKNVKENAVRYIRLYSISLHFPASLISVSTLRFFFNFGICMVIALSGLIIQISRCSNESIPSVILKTNYKVSEVDIG